jgi:hypothetical protein
MVVIAMECISELFSPGGVCYPMEDEPVCHIFKKCPEKYARQKNKEYDASTIIKFHFSHI